MIFLKIFLITVLSIIFIVFSFSYRLKIFQKLGILIGYFIFFIFIVFPELSDKVAHKISIKSGTDLMVYISLALVSLINIFLYVKTKNNEYKITKIIREKAKENAKKCK